MSPPPRPRLVLASRSAARRAMLTGAGVAFTPEESLVDEAAVKTSLAGIDAAALALELAKAKALAVSHRDPEAWVLGSDQTLALEGHGVTKAPDLAAARDRLVALRGRAHTLNAAAALARNGAVLWSGVETAHMVMRDFSDAFLTLYLDTEGEALLGSVGCYRLEGMGSQLFDRVEGDYFTVLGMPLWQVLAELRRAGVILT